MEEKIGENEEDKFSPKMPNSMPIVIKSNYLQFQKRQHCLWFNGQFRKQCLQEYWNKIISIWRKISEAEMKKSANIIVIPI